MNIYTKIINKNGYITALAPMEDVTDTVFRQTLCKIGKPDLMYTEFMNTDGYCSPGKEKIKHRIQFSKKERPLIIQIWGNTPEKYSQTVKEIKKLKPDGIDINMGCSVRNVLSNDSCSGLIQYPDLAKEIIEAVKKEAGKTPVSVKTRIGYDEIITEKWIGFLLEQNLDALTIHGRISKEGYNIPSRWEEIGKAVTLKILKKD
jgi:tRNA-dihydrouridine synthase